MNTEPGRGGVLLQAPNLRGVSSCVASRLRRIPAEGQDLGGSSAPVGAGDQPPVPGLPLRLGESNWAVERLIVRPTEEDIMASKSTRKSKATASRKRRPKNLAPKAAGDVKGGSLQAYVSKAQGEKQGVYRTP